MRVVLLGGPGAGKGTQAMRIADRFGVPHISTGAYFRTQLEKNTDLGQRIRMYMDSGKLVPDELTCEVVEARLKQPDCRRGYVLDGFPRSLPQASILDDLLGMRGEQIEIAIDLEVTDDEIVSRLSARRTCPVCGTIYNLKFSPPANGNSHCDRPGCNGELIIRADDSEDTIRQRLEVYHKTTEPIIKYYKERGLLTVVSGDNLGPNAIFTKVEELLGPLSRA